MNNPDLSMPAQDLLPVMATFTYQPDWTGVTAVDVIGGFGQGTDWTKPFVSLVKQGDGSFTGSAELPPGQYQYLFVTTGDKNGATPATYKHTAIDPANAAFDACPAASPTYDAAVANPCSQLTVPQAAAPTLYPVSGTVTFNGKAAPGYLAVLERSEKGSHHFFANMMETKADGSFSIMAVPGTYQVQVLYPNLESVTDAARTPLTLLAARRVIATAFPVTAATALSSVETAYKDYDKLLPTPTAKLPTMFQFTVIAGASKASLEIYGLGSATAKDIGDPWYSSTAGTATSATFNGTFSTAAAKETTAKTGEQYYFGTSQQLTHTGTETTWTLESMVLPITFQ
jgi:hypothetical protein